MTQPARPCFHCGNVHLVYVPDVLVDIAKGTTVLGMKAVSDLKNVYWQVTLVVCNQCGFTQSFTKNTAALAQAFGGVIHTVPQR